MYIISLIFNIILEIKIFLKSVIFFNQTFFESIFKYHQREICGNICQFYKKFPGNLIIK